MCLATGQRLKEVTNMPWEEIQDDIWTIPKSRTKNGLTHAVPLIGLAKKLLNKAKGKHDIWVYPSPLGLDQPVTIGTRNRKSVRVKTNISDFNPHDMRRTVETNLTKLGFFRFMADRLVNHIDGGVGKVYDRYDYLKEKKEAMTAWLEHLSKQIGPRLFD